MFIESGIRSTYIVSSKKRSEGFLDSLYESDCIVYSSVLHTVYLVLYQVLVLSKSKY